MIIRSLLLQKLVVDFAGWQGLDEWAKDALDRLEKGDALRVDVASACAHFAPHGNVRGPQYLVREPKVAHNSVRADASTLTLFALP